MSELTFTVPWEHLCPDNRKYVNGQFALTSRYRDAKTATALIAQVAARKAKWKRAEGMLGLEVVIVEPDRRVRDALNFSKALCDAITASESVWWDDSQIRDTRWRFEPISKTPDKANAGATIRIWSL